MSDVEYEASVRLIVKAQDERDEWKAKVAARPAVNFFMKLEPLGVLISESPPPPNIERPAPRPVCSSTNRTINRQAIMWIVNKK